MWQMFSSSFALCILRWDLLLVELETVRMRLSKSMDRHDVTLEVWLRSRCRVWAHADQSSTIGLGEPLPRDFLFLLVRACLLNPEPGQSSGKLASWLGLAPAVRLFATSLPHALLPAFSLNLGAISIHSLATDPCTPLANFGSLFCCSPPSFSQGLARPPSFPHHVSQSSHQAI